MNPSNPKRKKTVKACCKRCRSYKFAEDVSRKFCRKSACSCHSGKKVKTIQAWAAIVPGTNEPYASVGKYGRYYIVLCDPDAKQQAMRQAQESLHPEIYKKAVPVEITYTLP